MLQGFLDIASVDMQHIGKLSEKECNSTKMQQNQIIEWRRAKVMELLSKGESNQSEIARVLQVDKSTVCRDMAYLRQ
jgi:DNA-binding NarL/FixJ family response regulator